VSRDARIAAYVALGVLAACIVVNVPFLLSYAVRGDTAALMLHSTRFFPVDAGDWLRHGFERYFVNFPEATRPYTGFVRPLVNASIWLESLLAPGPNSAIFLTTNYLGHAACAGMVYLAARRIGGVTVRRALLAAALFGGTIGAIELLRSPAFRPDMMTAGFSLAALLAVDSWRRGRGWMLELAVLLLLLALLSKETAVTAPFLAAGWAMFAPGERPRRSRIAAAAALLLPPLGTFMLLRAGGPAGTYVSFDDVIGNVAEAATSAFFGGGGVFEVLTVLRGRAPSTVEAARMLLAFALNLVGLALVAVALLLRDRRAAVLVVMAAAAMAVPALLAPLPRMLYFGQMFALPLFAALLPRRRALSRPLAALALLAGPVWLLGWTAADQPTQVVVNRDSRDLQRAIEAGVRDPRVRRVYLVSDAVGDYAALALLQTATLRAGRPDVEPRVVNSMGRVGRATRRGTLEMRRSGGELVIDQRCGERCDFAFPGLLAGEESRLGVPGVIDYRVVEPRRLVVAIPERGCDALLIGFTPAAPGVHVLRPCDTAWRRAVSGRE
jgi:hypothetical protein